MKILSGKFNVKAETEGIFTLIFRNESLHEISNDSGVKVGNVSTSKNMFVISTIFPQQSNHKYTWTYLDGKTHNQFDHTLIGKRWHSSIIDIQPFRGAGHSKSYGETLGK
jgi:hypothetical protein